MLQVRLAAAPVEGAAKAALTKFLATALGLRHDEIAIRSGERSRIKIIDLTGDPASLLQRLDAWVAAASGPASAAGRRHGRQ